MEIDNVYRGDVVVVQFDPALGYEIRKQRPAIVVSSDEENAKETNRIIIVVPLSTMTAGRRPRRDEVLVEPGKSGLIAASVTLANQVRAVDRARVMRRLGRLTVHEMTCLEHRLQRVLQLA